MKTAFFYLGEMVEYGDTKQISKIRRKKELSVTFPAISADVVK